MDPDHGHLDSRRCATRRWLTAGVARAGAGRDGTVVHGIHCISVVHQQSLRTFVADGAERRCRFESLAAGLRTHRASADSVHGLRGFFRAVCVCDCGAHDRPPRCSLGTLVAALDQCRLGVSDSWYRAGQLVGLLRTGVGWLVVLGSRGERFLYAMAGGDRLSAFVGCDGEARTLQELDRAAGHFRVFLEPTRRVHRA